MAVGLTVSQIGRGQMSEDCAFIIIIIIITTIIIIIIHAKIKVTLSQ